MNTQDSDLLSVDEQISELVLSHGGHRSPDEGMCVMEAISYIAGEPFSEYPMCACPVITAFMIGFNDSLPDDVRERWIKPLIPAILNSRSLLESGEQDIGVQVERSLIAANAGLRQFIPFTFDMAADSFTLSGDTDRAELCAGWSAALRALPEQTTLEGLEAVARAAIDNPDSLTVLVSWANLSARSGRNDLRDLADRASCAIHGPENCTDSFMYCDNFAELANVAPFAVRSMASQVAARADEINECRASVVLKMLAVERS